VFILQLDLTTHVSRNLNFCRNVNVVETSMKVILHIGIVACSSGSDVERLCKIVTVHSEQSALTASHIPISEGLFFLSSVAGDKKERGNSPL